MSRPADIPDGLVADAGDGPLLFRFSSATDDPGLRHAITTRLGGGSRGRLAECNMSLLAPEPHAVTMGNRESVATAARMDLANWVCVEQVHGAGIRRATSADRGRGARDATGRLAATDALITTEANTALVVLGADCGLVLLRAPGRRALAVVHAGWRGLAQGVVARAVTALCEAAGLGPQQLQACVAPAIGPCCYQVGPEVLQALDRAPGELGSAFTTREGSLWLDIQHACMLQLITGGLQQGQVTGSDVCTSCRRDLFYSARGDGEPTGRFALIAMLE
jgi:YfiH family protein